MELMIIINKHIRHIMGVISDSRREAEVQRIKNKNIMLTEVIDKHFVIVLNSLFFSFFRKTSYMWVGSTFTDTVINVSLSSAMLTEHRVRIVLFGARCFSNSLEQTELMCSGMTL